MNFNLSARPDVKIGIDMADFCLAAKDNNLKTSAIRAMDEIESAGSGFLSGSKRPKILFEGHYFYKFMARQGMAEKAHKQEPSICYPHWTKQFYVGREGEYARLARATELCHEFDLSDGLALRSASWARYQVMGDNFRDAGFDSVEDFCEAMFSDEDNHLKAFIAYLKNSFLLDDLQKLPQNPDYYARIIASGYNGPGYRRNQYDRKIVVAFRKFEKQNIDCSRIGSGVHVVAAMPGIRAVNPPDFGVENTSLDDRYLDTQVDTTNLLDIPGSDAGKFPSIFNLNDDPDPDPKNDPAPSDDDPKNNAPDAAPNIAIAGGDINQTSADTIKAAQALPDTIIDTKGNTGFLAKITGAITALLTGQIVIPEFLQNGLFGSNLGDLFTRVFNGFWGLRYWIFGSLALWFVISQAKDFLLKHQTIITNTDPAKGNVQLITPTRIGIYAWLKSKLP